MAESELEARLLARLKVVEGQVNALQAQLRRLQAQITHPSARTYIQSQIGTATTATDHGTLIGLGDDDHVQYYNTARGDARWQQVTTVPWDRTTGLISPHTAGDNVHIGAGNFEAASLSTDGGTNKWALGANTGGSGLTLVTTAYVAITINGTPYKLAQVV